MSWQNLSSVADKARRIRIRLLNLGAPRIYSLSESCCASKNPGVAHAAAVSTAAGNSVNWTSAGSGRSIVCRQPWNMVKYHLMLVNLGLHLEIRAGRVRSSVGRQSWNAFCSAGGVSSLTPVLFDISC